MTDAQRQHDDHLIELRRLRPRITTLDWITRFVLVVTAVAVLLWAWNASEIRPGQLWEKRDNAWAFVFGRTLSQQERDAARTRAKRQIILLEEQRALETLRLADPAADPATLREHAVALAAAEIAALTPAERERRVYAEYRRTVRDLRGGFFPPETDPGNLRRYADALLETVAIAVWGSLSAVLLAIPMALLGANRSLRILISGEGRTVRMLRGSIHLATRRLFDLCRGFNEYVMALIFVAIIGLGPFPGVLALAVHTFGILGKVFSEAIETIDDGQVEGVASTGAGSAQIVSFAILPQIMPYVVSQSLLRFESNVRSATILGVVGAGGIGFLLQDKLQGFKMQEVCTMMIMIIIVVSLIDLVCAAVMKRFV